MEKFQQWRRRQEGKMGYILLWALGVPAIELERGNGDPSTAKLRDHEIWMDGGIQQGAIYDRAKLRAGDVIPGPAIVVEMDATTLIETRHAGTVDRFGNIMINPV